MEADYHSLGAAIGDVLRPAADERCSVPSSSSQLPAVWHDIEPELGRLAGAMGHNGSTAEDILQDVYLTALRKCPPDMERTELRRWLFRVTTNRCNLEHRRRKTRRSALQNWWRLRPSRNAEEQTTSEVVREEQRELVRNALHQLDELQRSVLVLRYFIDLDSQEISRILNIPDSTVRSHLRKARLRLAECLNPAEFNDE